MTTYTLEITTKRSIPTDVLVENIGYHLRAHSGGTKIKVTNVVGLELTEPAGRQHPFEGPEVFDDEPAPQYDFTKGDNWASGGYLPGTPLTEEDKKALLGAIRDDFPYLSQLFDAKRAGVPEGEGDWQLNANEADKIGEDTP